MSKVTKDGDFVLLSVPKKDLDSLIRFIAHSIDANPDRVQELAQSVVSGDLSNQDAVVNDLITLFAVDDWSIVLDGPEALKLCDELADTIYEEPKQGFGPVIKQKQEKHLRIVKICVDCHKGFIKGEAHDCEYK